MTRRLLLSLVMLVVGSALLVAAVVARPARGEPHREAPKGGTLRMRRSIDVDFVDPALAHALSRG